MIYIDLILNLTLLVALSIVSGFIEKRWARQTRLGALLQGVLFGGAAVIGMLRPLNLGSGLIFDGRSVMLSLCALFYGPSAALVAGAMTVFCRISLGGAGTLMGVLVVVSSVVIGLLGHYRLRPNVVPPSVQNLYLFGIVVHLAMLALTLTLPGNAGLTVLKRIGLPVMLLYPMATILAGKILADQVLAIRTLEELQMAKQNLAITLHSIGDAVISTNLKSEIVFMNPVAEALTGWSKVEALGRPLSEIFRIINETTREKVEDPVSKVLRECRVVGLANHTLLIAKGGKELPIADSAAPIQDEQGEIIGVVMVLRDQSEERRMQRLIQVRLTLLEYATSHTLDELLTKALDETCAIVDSPIGFYHFVEADQKTLSLQQWSTRTLDEFCRVEGRGMHYGVDQAGVWVDCVHRHEAVVHNDYASLPHRKGLPEGHAEVVRELVVPIIRQGKVVAILGVGNKPTNYTEKDVQTVAYLADETWQIVEKKRTEQELRENETLFRSLFEYHAAVKLLIDPDTGSIIDANQAAESYYGWSRERLRQMAIQDLNTLSPDKVKQEMEKARGLNRVYFELRHRRADGCIRDVEVYSSKIEVNGKDLLHSIIHDITESKLAELALEEELVRRRTLMDQSRDGIVILDQDGKVFETNRAFAGMLGYSMEEIEQLYVWDWDAQMTRHELEEAIRLIDASGDHFITRHRRKDGSFYYVEITSNAAVWKGQKHILCVCRDISERLKAEEALRESEKRLHRAEKVAHFGHWEFVLNTDQVNASEGARDIYGLGNDSWSIRDVQKIPLPEYRSMLDKALKELIEDGNPYIVEFKILRPTDGKILDIRSIAEYSPERGVVFGVVQDITEYKGAEEERKKLEIQLRQAQKLEAIGTLAGGIAHDFNNILAPIIGYTDMALADLPQSAPMRSDLKQILKAAHRARDLVKQILAFSRHGQEQERIPVEISTIAKEALKLMRASLPASIEIRQSIQRGMVVADATQIHQVLVNLCTNAAHALDGKGVLNVSLTSIELSESELASLSIMDLKPGPYLKLSVSDTGVGMDAKTMERIFEPYFTTKEVGKGSGLGLAVVHGIVKRHEGAISVRSEPGKGSTFEVFFPRIEMERAVFTEEASIVARGSERILLVDDERMVADLCTLMLERLGYRVSASTNALDALELIRSRSDAFDLVITDYTMPHLSGTELAAEILKICPDMPIILCTGYSERVTESAVKRLGIKGFSMKPLDRRQLAELVRTVLDGKGR